MFRLINSETMVPDTTHSRWTRTGNKKKISPRASFPSILVKTKLPRDPSINHITLWPCFVLAVPAVQSYQRLSSSGADAACPWPRRRSSARRASSRRITGRKRGGGGGGAGSRLMPKNPHDANLAHNIVASDHHRHGGDGDDIGDPVASVLRLDWHNLGGARDVVEGYRPDLIIGSDLVYYPTDLTPQLWTHSSMDELVMVERRRGDVDDDDDDGEEERHNLLRIKIVQLPYTLQD
jgi:hypothetical protein